MCRDVFIEYHRIVKAQRLSRPAVAFCRTILQLDAGAHHGQIGSGAPEVYRHLERSKYLGSLVIPHLVAKPFPAPYERHLANVRRTPECEILGCTILSMPILQISFRHRKRALFIHVDRAKFSR